MAAWFSNFQKVEETISFCSEEAAWVSPLLAPRTQRVSPGLAKFNYSYLPRPKLNTLVWPTGASRFGYFFGLSETAASGSGTLAFTDGSVSVSPSMNVLCSKKVSALGGLYILVLVDPRWDWQFKSVGNLTVDQDTTWDSLFSTVGAALGVAITTDAISADFLQPDPQELQRQYQNGAVMLDAMAASVGQRIVYSLSNTTSSMDSSHSNTGNFSVMDKITAGGQFDLEVPYAVNVLFPKSNDHAAWCNGEKYSVSTPIGGSSSKTLTIHSTCYADFTQGNDDPDNVDNLNKLGTAVSNAYAGWYGTGTGFDATFHCIKSWGLNGFTNFVEYSYSPDGVSEHYTRAQSMPPNFQVEAQLSQDPGVLPILEGIQWGVLTSPATADNGTSAVTPAQVEVFHFGDSGSDEDLGISVNAYDTLGGQASIQAGTKVDLFWHCKDHKWLMVKTSSTFAVVQVDESPGLQEGYAIKDSGFCLWQGLLVSFPSGGSGFCFSDNFQLGTQKVWLIAIDNPGGSVGTNATLAKGERYLAQPVGSFTAEGDSRPLYAIRKGSGISDYIRFELTEELLYGVDPAEENAERLVWNGSEYVGTGEALTVFDWTNDPDASYGTWSGQAETESNVGYQGLAIKKPDSDAYEIVWMETKARFIKFKLSEDITCNDESEGATVLAFWNGRDPDPESTGIIVWNLASTIESGKYKFAAPNNSVGYAVWDEKEEKYKIWVLENKARFIAGSLNTVLTAGGTVACTVSKYWDGSSPGGTVSVTDISGIFTGTIGRKFQATYSPCDDKYYFTWVQCPAS